MAYGAETIRAKIAETLEAISIAGGESFDVGVVEASGMIDPAILETPALQLTATDGAAEPVAANGRVGQERLAFQLDLFAIEGDLPNGLERAVADVRNALEATDSAVRAAGAARTVSVVSWEFVEGAEASRSATHRARFRVETDRLYNRGDA